jgi:hypothetical protein
MSTLFSISSGNLTDNIFARTISNADTISVTDVMGIGNTPVDITSFASDGSTIWGVSFNVKSRADNPTGLFSCKLYDTLNVERGSCVVPISNFPAGDGSNNIENAISQSWQTLKFDAPVNTTANANYYIRLSANTDGELYFYGLPQLDQSIIDYASGLDVVASGDASQSSFNPYSVKSWAWFMNDGGYISYPNSTSFLFGTSAFTIDFWCYLSETRLNRVLSLVDFNVDVDATNTLLISGVGTGLSVAQDKWNHIAITRNGNVMNGYVNGVKSDNITIASNKAFAQNTFFIGKDRTASTPYMHGYIFNLRVTKGQELYSSNFSVPTEPSSRNSNGGATPSNLPTGNNVSLLILGDENRLEDQANKRIQTVGSAGIVKRNPWVDNLSVINFYDMDPVSNTVYHRLDTGVIFNTGQFTIEGWFSIDKVLNEIYEMMMGLGWRMTAEFLGINVASTTIRYYCKNTFISETANIVGAGFQHFAVTRDSSNTTRFFRNGNIVATFSNDNTNYFRELSYVGVFDYTLFDVRGSGGSRSPRMSISNCRALNTAIYTANFTPEYNLKNIPGTVLLFADKPRYSRLQDYGNKTYNYKITTCPNISVSQGPASRIGRGMIDFANTALPYGLNIDGSAYDFLNAATYTFEFNIIFTRNLTLEGIFVAGFIAGVGPSFDLRHLATNEIRLTLRDGTTTVNHTILSPSEFQINKNYHFAFVKNGGLDIFVDGVKKINQGTVLSVNTSLDSRSIFYVFGNPLFAQSSTPRFGNPFVGQIDNIAACLKAKYTGNFTPNGAISINDSILYITGDDIDLNKDINATVGTVTIATNGAIYEYGTGGVTWDSASKYSTAIDYDITCFDYEESANFGISSTANFTLECWFNVKNYNNASIVSILNNGGFSLNALSGKPSFGITGGSPLVSATGPSLSTQPYRWHHLAVTRDSGTLRMYVNGVLSGTKLNDTTEFNSGILRVGGEANKNSFFDGILLGLRLTKDQALYTTNFTTASTYVTTSDNGGATPSTNPTPSNVAFLLCNSNAVDASTRIEPTIAGNSTLVAVPSSIGTPFNSEEIYSTTQHGGSIFFDNTGDLVTVSERSDEFTFASNDFTIEYWYFPYSLAASDEMVKTFSGTTNLADGIKFYYANATTPTVDIGNDGVTTVSLNATRNTLKQWNHFALTRQSGTVRFFINGDLVDATNFGGIVLQNDNDALIMGTNCNGYIADARIIKGQALYTDKFTPPATPLTINNTISQGLGVNALVTTPNLLIKGTTAGIYDSTANNTFTLSGAKFKVSLNETLNIDANYTDNALIFNGVFSNNFIIIPPSPSLNLVGDFWIDFWMNTTKWKRDSISRRILTLGSVSSVSALQICINPTGSDKKLQILSDTNILSSNFDYADGHWHHVGIGRSGSTLSLYRDGILDKSVTNNVDYKSGVVNNSYIGIYGGDTNPNKGRYGGKLVGLRIINGECVHTSNYDIPTEPATLISDGGSGINELGNVSLFMKLNNVISPVNSHVIVAETQSITGAITSPSTNTFTVNTLWGTVSSVVGADLPRKIPNTTVVRFSGGSIDVPTTNFQMKGDWTIEGYFKSLTANKNEGSDRILMDFNDNLFLVVSGSTPSYFFNCSNPSFSLEIPSGGLNTWRHIAICKKGDTVYTFSGGTKSSQLSVVDTATWGNIFTTANKFRMGARYVDVNVGKFIGEMYAVRITDGRALYSNNFNTSTIITTASTLSATADTVFLYNDARNINTYYNPGYLEKVVVGGSINSYDINPITVTCSLSDWAFNNISIQNNGTFLPTGSANSTHTITNNGLKIGSGGKFILSSEPTQKRILNLENSRIHVLPGGTLDVKGQPKTTKATLTGYYATGSNVFSLVETPTNWLSGDSLIFLPTSANKTQFEELTARRSLTNRLSTATASLYIHEKYDGIPNIVNATRNVSIKGLSQNRRGWLQFDKTSNTTILDAEFEHLGIDGKKTESLIFNIKQGGSFILSGCYVDGSTSTNVDATSFYGKTYNVTIQDNTFYKYSGDTLNFNKGVYNLNVKNNLILRSTGNGIKLENATISGNVILENNISLGNTLRGTYLDNVDGIIMGSINWMNASQGLYLGSPTKGESIDLTDEDATITESAAATNAVSFDNPFGDAYPEETSTYFTGNIKWDAKPSYNFEEDFTFEAFYKFSSTVNAQRYIFVCGYNSGLAGYDTVGSSLGTFRLDFNPATFTFNLFTNEGTNTSKFTAVTPGFRFKKWYHIALVRQGDLIALYFDGKKIGSYTSNFEFKAITGNIGLYPDANARHIYGFRVLTRAEYDTTQDTIAIPSAPFAVDEDTVLLYKRTVKTGETKIDNIQNYYNTAGGMLIDNASPSLKKTTISNISCVNNTTFGLAISGSNQDYRTANALTAKNIYIDGSSTIGLDIMNMTGILTGVYISNSTTSNARLKLGDGKTKISSITALMGNNNQNMIIYSSKSYRPALFNDIVLSKSSLLTSAYTGIPLTLANNEMINFHFDNSTLATVNTGFAVSLSGTVFGTYQFANTTITSAGVENLSCLPPDNTKSGGIIFMNKNRNIGSHESFYRKGKRATDTSLVAGNVAEKISPRIASDKFKSGSKFVAVSTNDVVDLKLKVAVTNDYNGNNPRFILKKNASLGFTEDRVLYTFPEATSYSETTLTTPSASGVGIMEFYVDCDGTAGSVIIDEWKAK